MNVFFKYSFGLAEWTQVLQCERACMSILLYNEHSSPLLCILCMSFSPIWVIEQNLIDLCCSNTSMKSLSQTEATPGCFWLWLFYLLPPRPLSVWFLLRFYRKLRSSTDWTWLVFGVCRWRKNSREVSVLPKCIKTVKQKTPWRRSKCAETWSAVLER